MASSTGYNDAGSSGDAISFQLQSIDLPSRLLIGKGLSGVVYETIWKGERFARKDFVDVPSDVFLQEAAVLVGMKDHENIVKTYGWTVDKRSCSLVLEYMDDDLLSLLKKIMESKHYPAGVGFSDQSSAATSTQPFDLPELLDILLQLARGMESLHKQGIAHGDLKTKNILVTHVNDGQKLVKVTDFGLIQTKRNSESNVSRQVRKLDIVKWKAPEYLDTLFRQLNVSNDEDETSSDWSSGSESEETSAPPVVEFNVFAADVYSFAVTCSQILTGKDPYPNPDWKDLRNKILSGLRPNLPDACPILLRNLLILCWGTRPSDRPTFSKIHEWLEVHRDELLARGFEECLGHFDHECQNRPPSEPHSTHLTERVTVEDDADYLDDLAQKLNLADTLTASRLPKRRTPYFDNHSTSLGGEPSDILEDMVKDFIESDGFEECDFDNHSTSLGGESSEILQDLVKNVNETEQMLLGEVNKAIAVASDVVVAESGVSTCLRRQVMKHLRTSGHNAAICKSWWEHMGDVPGGEYEYIDVVFMGMTGRSYRIIIDIDFRRCFEIARPSSSYKGVLQVLPVVFVGKADRLLQIVNIMSNAMKLSCKSRGLFLPPWRKPEFIRAKWFSSYKRTTDDTVHRVHRGDMANNISQISVRPDAHSSSTPDKRSKQNNDLPLVQNSVETLC